MSYGTRRAAALGIVYLTTALFFSPISIAKPSGITGESGNPLAGNQDCNKCHAGGIAPTVTLNSVDGTNTLAGGETKEFVLTISGGQQAGGGLNVSQEINSNLIVPGTLAVSPNDAGVKLLNGEITHTSPRAANAAGEVSFRFLWTAPPVPAPTQLFLYAAGNSVNLDGTDRGDASSAVAAPITVNVGVNVPPKAVIANGPEILASVGDVINYSSAGSVDLDGSLISYDWEFGDGATSSEANPSYTYSFPSPPAGFAVMLTVTDDVGATGTANATAVIFGDNIPPTANPGGPFVRTLGQTIVFDGRQSSDIDGDLVHYAWDFGDGSTALGPTRTKMYTRVGSYTVMLTVTDDGTPQLSASATTTATITPERDPLADPNGPYAASVGDVVQFSSANSFASSGIRNYLWRFGDGASSAAKNPTHAYSAAGVYTISLQIVSNTFKTDIVKTTATITTGIHPPVARAGGPYAGIVGTPVSFDGNGSRAATGVTIIAYDWTFGDGSSLFNAGPTPTHTYQNGGLFKPSLVVTDEFGVKSAASSTTAAIDGTAVGPNSPPTARAKGPYYAPAGVDIAFDGSTSSDADGSVIAWFWDFGDGTTALGPNRLKAYDAIGDYVVTLTVVDNGGRQLSNTTNTTAKAHDGTDPKADPGGPYSGIVNAPLQFSSARSYASAGIRNYLWDFGDSARSTAANPAHTYVAVGTYNISLQVIDYLFRNHIGKTTATIAPATPPPPIANPGGPYQGLVNTAVAFDGSASSATAPGATIASYDWNFGDGTVLANGGPTPVHSYTLVGSYSVSLVVKDSNGTASAPTQTTVTITDTAQPSITRFRAPGKVTVRSGTTVTKSFRVNVELTGVGPGEQRPVTVFLSGSNGALYQAGTTVTAGTAVTVELSHTFTQSDAPRVDWTAWAALDSGGNESSRVMATTIVTIN